MSRTALLVLLLILLGATFLTAAGYLYLQENDDLVRAAPGEVDAALSPLESPGFAPAETPTIVQPPQATFQATAAPPAADQMAILVQEDGAARSITTDAANVGELLDGIGIALGEHDQLYPPLNTPLQNGMQVRILRAIPLTLQVDGQTLSVFSAGRTPREVLAGAGVALGALDVVRAGEDGSLSAGDTIEVVRVREETIVEDETIPFQTVYQPSDQLDLDTKAVLSGGSPGIKRRSTRVRYENGVETGREVEGEWIEQEAVNEVIGYGTRITTNVVDTPDGPREYWRVVNMRVTAYTAASSGKSPDHPAYGITASGRPAGTGIVAVDPNVIPFRSEVFVPGYGIGFAGDTGGGIKGRWIDLGYDEDELQAWNGYVDVYYLTPIPAEISYLLPEVLP